MEFTKVIENRFSVRGYLQKAVEEEKLNKILEAGILAPTACNNQAYKILVIKTEGKKANLQKIYNTNWFVQAPFILCVCSIPQACWVRDDGKNHSDVDATIVMDHMILEATNQGLGTCWIADFNVQAAKELLNLPDALEPVILTPIGYSNADAPQKRRHNLDSLVLYR